MQNRVAPPKGRHLLFRIELVLPLLGLLLVGIVFNLWPLDLLLQSLFYKGGWYLGEKPFIQAFYKYSNIPALLTVLISLYVYASGFKRNSHYIRYRKIAVYLLLVMLIGPGLIINSLLKDQWGRPRPRDIVDYGGKYAYEAPFTMDKSSPGKSFPCGHASMGFYFFALAFALGYKRDKRLKLLIMLSALLYGSVIGLVRIMQGGHFLSDVIVSALILYLVSAALWYIMKLDLEPYYIPKEKETKLKIWQLIVAIILVILIFVGIIIASPYSKTQEIFSEKLKEQSIELSLKKAELTIVLADSSNVKSLVNGFGFPGSKVKIRQKRGEDALFLKQEIKGIFSEMIVNVQVLADTTATNPFKIELAKGKASLYLPQDEFQKYKKKMKKQNGGSYHIVLKNVEISSPQIELKRAE